MSCRSLRPRSPHGSLAASVLFLGLTLAACGTAHLPLAEVTAAELPRLEAEAARNPDSAPVLVRLGAAYRAADRPEDAVASLERARELDPAHPNAVLLLGLAYEDTERWTEARALYERYLELVPDSPARNRIRSRIELAERREIEAVVREAIAREQELTRAPSPTTLAVFPFRFAGGDPELAPLGYALAGMLTTDLAEAGRFQVLERQHVDVLMAEIALAEEGLVDPSTAARSGRLLGAGRIVQGRLGGTEERFELDAAVVEVTPADPRVRPIELEEGLTELFDMEKALVLDLFESMGVTLTEAERERILERRTENLQALLAYGRGLQAEQEGAFGVAAEHFRTAASLDPSFLAAAAGARQAEQLSAASESSTGEVLAAAGEGEQPEAPDPVDVVEAAVTRDPAQEVLGTEQISTGVVLQIVIRRPGGAQ